MKKFLLLLAAATFAFAACNPDDEPIIGGEETEVCEECGKNPCECPTTSDTELFLTATVNLQHGVNTNYEGDVAIFDVAKVASFFEMTEAEFYLAMGSLESNAQINNTLLFGNAYKDGGEWVYDFTPQTSNNFGHWLTKEGTVTTWGEDSFMFTENRAWWGYESLDAAIADGMTAGLLDFSVGMHPDFYDGNVGDSYSATEFIFDSNSQKTAYLTFDIKIVDFIDSEAGKYEGTPADGSMTATLNYAEGAVELEDLKKAFCLTTFEMAGAFDAGQIVTANYINDELVEPCAGGRGGVWFDAEGNRCPWGTDADEDGVVESTYYVELQSTATALYTAGGFFSDDHKAAMAGKTCDTFKQVLTYTPSEGTSYTFTINYNLVF